MTVSEAIRVVDKDAVPMSYVRLRYPEVFDAVMTLVSYAEGEKARES
jgi:hypothetical protein